MSEELLRKKVLQSVREYYEAVHKPQKEFVAGERISYAGRIFDHREMEYLAESMLDFWLTAGKFHTIFENKLAEFLQIKYCAMVNSGSSANLLAFMTLTSDLLEDRKIHRGDEVITVAAGFPTTVAPIIQYGAVPVFIDVNLPSYNITFEQLELAISAKTKAVFLAHTLGNPFNLSVIKKFCNQYKLWLIEDNCDALGSEYFYQNKWVKTGTIGDIATSSFYPAHHMTTGEGGAVYTNNELLAKIMYSLRDWGKDCTCPTGKDNICGKRFSGKFSELPNGYDHKYVYSHFGYNLKATEMQAAIGVAQLEKLPSFVAMRNKNWQLLYDDLSDLDKLFLLPQSEEDSRPSWFGFMLTVRENNGFSRDDIVKHLEQHGIQTRMLFAGNITKQMCFDAMRSSGNGYRIVGSLKNTDIIMNNTFWLGVYPGLSREKIHYISKTIRDYVGK